MKLFDEWEMQPIRRLMSTISKLATPQACLFTIADLRKILPDLSVSAFKTLLSRAASEGHFTRICRGLYLYEKANPDRGLILAHAVNKLRPLDLNYLSLESALSDAGVISQIPINRLMIMTSSRSSVIDCGQWGSIEFIHTNQHPNELIGQLKYDTNYQMWRATVRQALRDMKATRRSQDLIDWNAADELI